MTSQLTPKIELILYTFRLGHMIKDLIYNTNDDIEELMIDEKNFEAVIRNSDRARHKKQDR